MAHEYGDASAILADENNNRLSRTRVGRRTGEYCYEGSAGITCSMTLMATVPFLKYNYADHMVASLSQSEDPEKTACQEITGYRYDATGKRVRKVTDRTLADGAAMPVQETLYIGGAFEVFRRYSGSGVATFEIHRLTIVESGR